VFAIGAGVRPGATFEGARAEDIVPTALALLGCARAEDLTGRYLAEGFTVAPPGAVVPTWERGRYRTQLAGLLGEGEGAGADLEKLPSLAYVGSATHLSDPVSQVLVALAQRRMTDARRIIESALPRHPDSALLHGILADLFRNYRKLDQAEAEYRKAIRLAPGEIVYRINLARLLAQTDRRPEAWKLMQETILLEPADAAIHMVSAGLLLDAGRRQEGMSALARAIELEPDSFTARTRLGTHLLERGNLAAAEHQLRAARDLEPGSPSAWNNLCVTLLRRVERAGGSGEEKRAAARETLDEAIRRFPDYAKVWHNRAVLNRMAGRRDAARADVDRALAIDPEYEAAKRLKTELK